MKLIGLSKMFFMTPWEIVEQALARKNPPRNQMWLAERLGATPQAVNNWKKRGLPYSRLRQVAESLGLSVDHYGSAPGDLSTPYRVAVSFRAAPLAAPAVVRSTARKRKNPQVLTVPRRNLGPFRVTVRA